MNNNGFSFELDVATPQEYNPWVHSPSYKAVHMVKPGSTVLDFGCATGHIAKILKEKSCRVFGIEKDPQAALKAKRYCEKVMDVDIEQVGLLPFDNDFFDYILCLDVLEHLVRPDNVLSKFVPCLKPSGKMIISIPNIARVEQRINLLLGKFDYVPWGVLSKAHLRFFTYSSAKALIEAQGLKVVGVEPTGLGSMIRILPRLLAFQFIFIAEKL